MTESQPEGDVRDNTDGTGRPDDADWRTLDADDGDDGLDRLSPEEVEHVTLSATVDVSDLDGHATEALLALADDYEQGFRATAAAFSERA